LGKRKISYNTGVEGLILHCNNPGCPTKYHGCSEMVPQPNRSIYKCPTCKASTIITMEEDDSLPQKNVQYRLTRTKTLPLFTLKDGRKIFIEGNGIHKNDGIEIAMQIINFFGLQLIGELR